MYANYNYLIGGGNHCKATSFTAFTDSTRFSCSNLALQPVVRSSIQSPIVSNGEIDCDHGGCNRDTTPGCNYQCEKPFPSSAVLAAPQLAPPPSLSLDSSSIDNNNTIVENYCPGKTPISSITPVSVSSLPFSEVDTLLPVMDPRFNLREICKQCILLEDHLTHPEKRCTDCCIKHFLTIEALAEEAVTLDKDQKIPNLIHIPVKVRSLQDMWYKNPDDNAHAVSQHLREIRKIYQINNFDVIFRDDKQQCSGGVCSIKKNKKK